MTEAMFTLTVIGSTFIDLFVAAFGLLCPTISRTPEGKARPIGLNRVILAGLVCGVLFIAKLILLAQFGLDIFGMICLLYVDLVVVFPLLGIGTLVLSRKRGKAKPRCAVTRPVRYLAMLAVLAAPVGLYATFVEPYQVQTETATLHAAPEHSPLTSLRIGILADIQTAHITDYERSAVNRLMAMKPDIILVPGDLYQGPPSDFEAELPAFRSLLARINMAEHIGPQPIARVPAGSHLSDKRPDMR